MSTANSSSTPSTEASTSFEPPTWSSAAYNCDYFQATDQYVFLRASSAMGATIELAPVEMSSHSSHLLISHDWKDNFATADQFNSPEHALRASAEALQLTHDPWYGEWKQRCLMLTEAIGGERSRSEAAEGLRLDNMGLVGYALDDKGIDPVPTASHVETGVRMVADFLDAVAEQHSFDVPANLFEQFEFTLEPENDWGIPVASSVQYRPTGHTVATRR